MESALKSPWLWGMIAFMAVVLTANLLLVYFAVKTSPGLVAKDYYERGQNLTTRTKLKEKNLQKPDWKMNLTIPDLKTGQSANFVLAVFSNSKTVEAESVEIFAYRPSDARKDFTSTMKNIGGGKYEATLTFNLPGYWDLIVVAKKGVMEADVARRIFVSNM